MYELNAVLTLAPLPEVEERRRHVVHTKTIRPRCKTIWEDLMTTDLSKTSWAAMADQKRRRRQYGQPVKYSTTNGHHLEPLLMTDPKTKGPLNQDLDNSRMSQKNFSIKKQKSPFRRTHIPLHMPLTITSMQPAPLSSRALGKQFPKISPISAETKGHDQDSNDTPARYLLLDQIGRTLHPTPLTSSRTSPLPPIVTTLTTPRTTSPLADVADPTFMMTETPNNRTQPVPKLPSSRMSSSEVPETGLFDAEPARPTSSTSEGHGHTGRVSEKAIRITDTSSEPELPSSSSVPDKPANMEPSSVVPEINTKEPEKEAKLPTEEEKLQQEADGVLQHWKDLFSRYPSVPLHSEDNSNSFTREFLFVLRQINQSYFVFDEYPRDILEACRQKAGEHLATSGMVSVLCDVIVQGLKAAEYQSEESLSRNMWLDALNNALSALWNFTDCSRDVVLAVDQHASLLATLLEKLKEWSAFYFDGTLNEIDAEFMVMCAVSILHNVAMHDESIPGLRDLNTTEILLPYLKSSSEIIKFVTAATLAEVMTEKEADDLATSPDVARFMLHQLKNALGDEKHRYNGFSVQELVRAVRQLARNDANKRLVVEEGALPLLTEGIQSTYLQERNGCLEAIWMLSFNKKNTEDMMKDEALLDTVVRVYRDHTAPESSRNLSHGILWQLRYELEKSEKFGDVGKQLLKKTVRQRSARGHVMVSYQWADQEIVLRICDYLKREGFRVWIDLENMGGSTLQAMAEAIEQAFVVISCMSQRYKDSPNCRAEAEYAFNMRKDIIPLIMQKGYKPDGWLGMILGAKMFYDFSGKYPFETRISLLTKAVQKISTGSQELDTVDGPTEDSSGFQTEARFKPTAEAIYGFLSSRTEPTEIMKKLQTWKSQEVQVWLKKFDLAGPELESLTGTDLVFLDKIHSEAPEFFYKVLEQKLQIQTLSGLKKFMDALEALPSLLPEHD